MPPRPAKKGLKKGASSTPKKVEVPTESESVVVQSENASTEAAVAPEVELASNETTAVASQDLAQEAVEEEAAEPKDENDEEGDEVEEPEDASADSGEMEAEEGNDEDGTSLDKVDKTLEESEHADQEGKDGQDGDDNEEVDDDNDETDKVEDPSMYLHSSSEESKSLKELKIFVGGLGNKLTEDDLIKTFSTYGEVKLARVVRHPVSKRSRGFAFLQFSNAEEAKKAISDSNGIEVQGKRLHVSACTSNDMLYLGNICKTWTADQVTEALKSHGLEKHFQIILPDDPSQEGNNKGFAFLEFLSHFDAMDALQHLKSSKACFGLEKCAKVAFARTMKPSEDQDLSQVKTVYVEGLPPTWDEEKVKDICKQYGEIERIELSRNFSKRRRKDFGFIAFVSRESAVSCVEGLNSGQIGEGEIKISANIAKSEKKQRIAKSNNAKSKENDEDVDEMDQSGDDENDEKPKVAKSSTNSKNAKSVKNQSGKKGIKRPLDISSAKMLKGKKFNKSFESYPQKRQRKDAGYGGRGRNPKAASGHGHDLEPHAGLLSTEGRGHGTPHYDLRAQHRRFTSQAGGHLEYSSSAFMHYPGYEAGYPYAGSRAYYPPGRAYH